MTAKEYLSQAYRLDVRIDSKIRQVSSLNDLAGKCTPVLSDMPKAPSGPTSRMEEIIVKIIDLENEINADIDRLVDLKAEIAGVIKKVANMEYQTILERRYLAGMSVEDIASSMGKSERQIYRMLKEAYQEVVVPET